MAEDRPGELVELVDTLLRNLGTIEQSITSGKEREAALAEISLLGAFVQRGAFLLRGPKFRAPTDTLMRVDNGVLGFMARTETDAGMLEREPPDAKPPISHGHPKGPRDCGCGDGVPHQHEAEAADTGRKVGRDPDGIIQAV